jgi:hypothetical protein
VTTARRSGASRPTGQRVDDLGSRPAVAYLTTVLAEGASADRQLRIFKETGRLNDVVDFVARETTAGTRVEQLAQK